jgi:rare lipoprotein A
LRPQGARNGSACASALLLVALGGGCAKRVPEPVGPSEVRELPKETAPDAISVQHGKASWYGREQQHHKTANGERCNMHDLTAAHLRLPMQTRVRVVNLQNGRSVVVRINDRGPYGRRCIIDVSYAAAKQLDMIKAGIVPVRLEVLGP